MAALTRDPQTSKIKIVRRPGPLGRALVGAKPHGETHWSPIPHRRSAGDAPYRNFIARPLKADCARVGWAEKRGADIPGARGFRNRYFMLAGEHLYWFRKETDVRFTGVIQLLFASFRKESEGKSGSPSSASEMFDSLRQEDNRSSQSVEGGGGDDATGSSRRFASEGNDRDSSEALSTLHLTAPHSTPRTSGAVVNRPKEKQAAVTLPDSDNSVAVAGCDGGDTNGADGGDYRIRIATSVPAATTLPTPGEETKSSSRCFKIITPVRVFHMRARTPEEADAWLDALHEAQRVLWEREHHIAANAEEVPIDDTVLTGFLIKRGHDLKKTWKRRFFVLKQKYLSYFPDDRTSTPLGTIALLQCAVKPADIRPFALEFVTPSRSVFVCAASIEDFSNWLGAINHQIAMTLDSFFEGTEASTNVDGTGIPTVGGGAGRGNLSGSSDGIDDPVQQPAQSLSHASGAVVPDGDCNSIATANPLDGEYCSTEDDEDDEDADIEDDPNDNDGNAISRRASVPLHTQRSMFAELTALAGNSFCCECDEPDPRWASINLGVFLCIECSGIHRSLGVHVSKVRSLELDQWKDEQIVFMRSMGNLRSRSIWEHALSQDMPSSEWQQTDLGDGRSGTRVSFVNAAQRVVMKPVPTSPREEKEAWIRAKYVERLFADLDVVMPISISDTTSRRMSVQRSDTQKAAWLWKLPPVGKLKQSWKKRFFILKRNVVYYYKSDMATPMPIGVISLGSATRVAAGLPEGYGVVPGGPDGLVIQPLTVYTPDRNFVIGSPDSGDVFSWIQTIDASMAFYRTRPESESFSESSAASSLRNSVTDPSAPQNARGVRARYTMVLNPKLVTHAGPLHYKVSSIKGYKKRFVTLYRKSLYIYSEEGQPIPMLVIDLGAACKVVCQSLPSQYKFFFRLITPTATAPHKFYADSRAEMVAWMKAIKLAVSSGNAPRWVKTGQSAEEALAAAEDPFPAKSPSRLSKMLDQLEEAGYDARAPSGSSSFIEPPTPTADSGSITNVGSYSSDSAERLKAPPSASTLDPLPDSIAPRAAAAYDSLAAVSAGLETTESASPLYQNTTELLRDSSSPLYQTTAGLRDADSPLYQTTAELRTIYNTMKEFRPDDIGASEAAPTEHTPDPTPLRASLNVAPLTDVNSAVVTPVDAVPVHAIPISQATAATLNSDAVPSDSSWTAELGNIWNGLDRDIDRLLEAVADDGQLDVGNDEFGELAFTFS